jgi:hypothetical protein
MVEIFEAIINKSFWIGSDPFNTYVRKDINRVLILFSDHNQARPGVQAFHILPFWRTFI